MPSCGAGADGGGGRRTDHAVTAMVTIAICSLMITMDFRCWGLHLKSETVDQASAAPRRLVIEQTIQL